MGRYVNKSITRPHWLWLAGFFAVWFGVYWFKFGMSKRASYVGFSILFGVIFGWLLIRFGEDNGVGIVVIGYAAGGFVLWRLSKTSKRRRRGRRRRRWLPLPPSQVNLGFLHWAENRSDAIASVRVDSDSWATGQLDGSITSFVGVDSAAYGCWVHRCGLSWTNSFQSTSGAQHECSRVWCVKCIVYSLE